MSKYLDSVEGFLSRKHLAYARTPTYVKLTTNINSMPVNLFFHDAEGGRIGLCTSAVDADIFERVDQPQADIQVSDLPADQRILFQNKMCLTGGTLSEIEFLGLLEETVALSAIFAGVAHQMDDDDDDEDHEEEDDDDCDGDCDDEYDDDPFGEAESDE